MAVNYDRLVQASMRLRMTEAAYWEEFVLALAEVAQSQTNQMLTVDISMLPKAQGMAYMANEVAAVLHTAPARYEKIEQQIKAGKRNVNG